ncbi:MAG: PfkB family carbohydrate kinase, partial [Planctomycetota bacterium]
MRTPPVLRALDFGRPIPERIETVAGLGLTVVDRQLVLPALPGPDEKTTAVGARMQIGGPVPTALAQLAKLGGPPGALLSAWGDDANGAAIETDLQSVGISFDPAGCRTEKHTGVAQIWVEQETGRRSVAALRSRGDGLTPERVRTFGASADLLHVDGWPGPAAVQACRAARDGGRLVSVDLGASEKPPELIALADVLNLPAQALRRLTDERDPVAAVTALCEQGPALVTLTNGSQGCWFAARTLGGVEAGFVPAFPVT